MPLAGIIAVVVLSRVTRHIQKKSLRHGLVDVVATDAAKAAWDPEGIFTWEARYRLSNFGVADDDVYARMAPAKDIISDARVMSEEIFLEYGRSAMR